MRPDDILELEISLLLIKYGEMKVIKSLSKLIGLKNDDLKTKLKMISKSKDSCQINNYRLDSIDNIIDKYPEKRNLLKDLYDRYQNKTFLPEFRDIKRLLNRHYIELEKIKSRKSAIKKVFDLLSSLDENELKELAQQKERTNMSSLGIISDQILGHKD